MYTTKRHRNHRDILALLLNIAALTTGLRRATIYKKIATITHLIGTIREILAKAPTAAIDAFIIAVEDVIALRHTALPRIRRVLTPQSKRNVRVDEVASAEYDLPVLEHLERDEAVWNSTIPFQDSPQASTSQAIDQVPYSAVSSGFSFAQEEPTPVAVADAPVRATTRKKRASRATGAATGKVGGTPVRPVAGPLGDNPGNVPASTVYRKKGNKYTIVKRKVKGECLYTMDNSGNYIPL